MPPIAKEPEVLTATPRISTANLPSTSAPAESSPARPQPVALEVPVTVNGARTVEGSEKREPFSETTKTVLVYSHGAVIRLASAVTPGQLLFLTNEKTKKEVVCQVVKSKNYRNVSGYVEMEFTEPVIGFWGMRFPNDRIGPAPVVHAPVAKIAPLPPPPAAPKAEPPAINVTPAKVKEQPVLAKPVEAQVAEVKPVERKPAEISVNPLEAPVISIPVTPTAAVPNAPQVSDVQRVTVEPQSAQTQAPAPRNPEPAESSTEALRLETARLQEQLSSMLFSEAPVSKLVQEQPAELGADKKTLANVTSKILEFAKDQPAPVPPVKSVPPAPRPSLDEESVKIPAWLEPLARNTVAPSSTQELIEREKAKRAADKLEHSEPEVETLAITEVENLPEVRVPSFGSELLFDEKAGSGGKVSRGSNKGLWIGAVAAGLILLAGGGVWYMRQQAGAVRNYVASASAPAAAVTASVLHSQPAVVPQTAPVNNLAAAPPATVTSTPAVNSQIATPHDAAAPAGTSNTTVMPKVVPKSTQPVPVDEPPQLLQVLQQKKPVLGEVHLASPKANRRVSSEVSGAAEPGLALSGEQITPGSDASGGDLVAGSVKQPAAPAAPLPVGGDVKPAKMISSVPPVYPALARSQHVSGDVKIDALIDANGRVTSMKVISGPTLLHHSAMDALHQWKYQPATLDGNPVPMHLTITLQFRLQ